MQQHMQAMHGSFVCEMCGFTTSVRAEFKKHARSHPGGGVWGNKKKVCQECKFKFSRGEEERGSHQCPTEIGPGPPDPSLLIAAPVGRSHLMKGLGVLAASGKPVCRVCGFTSVLRLKVQRHIRLVHAQFVCHLCRYRASEKAALRKHLKYFHQLRCSRCGSYCKDEAAMASHSCPPELEKLGNASSEPLSDMSQAVSCPHCDFVPASGKFLAPHIRAAHGEREKVPDCEICGRKFKTRRGRRLHMVKMHSETT